MKQSGPNKNQNILTTPYYQNYDSCVQLNLFLINN